MRVLASARRRDVDALDDTLEAEWELLGLEAMLDPPREVAACREAGTSCSEPAAIRDAPDPY
jgi:hypothetical protein